MDLIFFDLDGTLLNNTSRISPYTLETLALLTEKGIAHTFATGRTMLSAKDLIKGHCFDLPHIYSNGVVVWDPNDKHLMLDNLLEYKELTTIIECAHANGLTPFVNTIDIIQGAEQHVVYHSPARHQIEKDYINTFFSRIHSTLRPLDALPPNSHVTNISMIGEANVITSIWQHLNLQETLIAYSGPATEGGGNHWIDVHHRLANKGSAIESLKAQMGASNVICFGDSDNDSSMFAIADECYAPSNAKDTIKNAANQVIGHHHDDGVAHFLRERFSL